jgi:hypothetical protein
VAHYVILLLSTSKLFGVHTEEVLVGQFTLHTFESDKKEPAPKKLALRRGAQAKIHKLASPSSQPISVQYAWLLRRSEVKTTSPLLSFF